MRANVIIEKRKNGYDAYMKDTVNFDFGLLGQGGTAKDAISDFVACRDDMKELYEDEGKHFPELEFEFSYDVASFLNYYSSILSLAGLGRLIGINQHQLSHYATGHRTPRPAMVKKIETSLHNFSKELSQVHFNV